MSCIAQFAQDYGPFITAGAIFISGLIAFLAIVHNLRAVRRRATIDLMMHEKVNQALVAARKKVRDLQDAQDEFTKYAEKKYAGSEERTAILDVLNFQEFVAAGIREKAFDEAMYKRIQYSVVSRDWKNSEGFILKLRTTHARPTLFMEFQWLADRWQRNPLKAK